MTQQSTILDMYNKTAYKLSCCTGVANAFFCGAWRDGSVHRVPRPSRCSGLALKMRVVRILSNGRVSRTQAQQNKNPHLAGFCFGVPQPSISKRQQPIEFIKLPSLEKPDFSGEIIENYQKGFSLSEIAKLIGCSKAKVLSTLRKHSVNTRSKSAIPTPQLTRYGGRAHNKPYFGFCYMDGKLVKHPTEFPILRIIHRKWKAKISVHHIACQLNKDKIKSREGREWSWAAVRNIVDRFENENIILHPGGKYEFR